MTFLAIARNNALDIADVLFRANTAVSEQWVLGDPLPAELAID